MVRFGVALTIEVSDVQTGLDAAVGKELAVNLIRAERKVAVWLGTLHFPRAGFDRLSDKP